MGHEGVVMSKLRLFLATLNLPLSATLLALSAVIHSTPQAIWAVILMIYSTYVITDEVYL